MSIAFKRLKKRSDLPDWFPLEVYQRELSKRKWISEILVRCVLALVPFNSNEMI
jgi:hypothetical protein